MADTGQLPPGTVTDPRPYLRGAGTVSPDGRCSRLSAANAYRLPADTWDCAQIPAGVRLELTSDAEALQLFYTAEEAHPSAATTMAASFSVWQDDRRVHRVEAHTGTQVAVLPLGGPVRSRYTIYLPEMLLPRVHGLRPVNGEIAPVGSEPVWSAYGDSITQGWSATDPGLTYPATIARRRGLDVHNLGFAAAARGEIPVAEEIASARPAYVTLAFGTNNWPRLPTGHRHIAEILRDFITVIRHGAPNARFVVISPLLRPEAEDMPNLAGATLHQLRSAIETTVVEMQGKEVDLRLVPGRELVPVSGLVEGVHPTDPGHAAIAEALESAMFDGVLPQDVTTEEGFSQVTP